ncbi:PH-domain-containing protein [Hortaea werneckii]|nr:PH-domain-containing protein [Hortaea werneckii]
MADVDDRADLRKVSNTHNLPPPTNPQAVNESSRSSGNPRLTLDTFSSVNQNGSFDFDRIIKSGEVLKRTRKTKSWKPVFIVLRPNLLSIYRDKQETKLRHQINLVELTAVARQKDPRRKDKHVFGLFTPSRNYHVEAKSEQEAQEWVELIRQQARMDVDGEEMVLASPGGSKNNAWQAFGRSIDAHLVQQNEDRSGYTSSDAEAMMSPFSVPKGRDRGNTTATTRRPSQIEYSGADYGSYSDFSDSGLPAAHMSTLSLGTEGRPSSSYQHPQGHPVYGQPSARPSIGARNPSQVSGIGAPQDSSKTTPVQSPTDDERVIYHGWIYLLKSKSGVRQWKKIWMVLRPKAVALYKNEEEYTALLIVPLPNVIDVVEIDPISKSKTSCMQLLSQERNYRFCALDEESLTRWLGAFKSLLSKRKLKETAKTQEPNAGNVPVAVQPPQ